MATLLDGKKLSQKICSTLKSKVEKLKDKKPGLAVILVGDHSASQIYVAKKEKTAREFGFYSEVHKLPSACEEKEILNLIKYLNESPKIHGILVQLPLPAHIQTHAILNAVSPLKDVDGFHPLNLGRLFIGDPLFIPCTPQGVMELFKEYKIELSGKHAVVIGRSLIVGKPLAHLLLGQNATVTICHSKTKNLEAVCQTADILISAIGKPLFIKNSFVKEGAVVVDVGINRLNNKIVGDVDFENVQKKASFITPVPGGVGPMTIALLLQNTFKSFERFSS
ncbi:MAG: bifunctional methylenetetrahydrofolate dehydrogenase/methenyltetrahydrofolate cyclohydrolase FolD [Deltaproteobacteria bacterium]|nr:bifunctional methylenetetrahydrofolate dehydrogenase/methenyltetrahydrofolate cyclohydrolase FolD [Deltaproteobacteria bacterium]MBI3018091.1 bifunctional methylenetetrahydrofolate dehydrogenase/methenyltetrahydrofolate cyclohydrolase FolD [Deltaproteobacteria bacterium]